MCAKYYENPIILSRVTVKNVGDVFLRHTVENVAITKFISVFGYLAAFSNAGGSKLIDVENDTKFGTF